LLFDGADAPCIVYLSGGMTGTADHGVAAFAEAREALRARGYTVLCPSEASIAQNMKEKRTREHHLRRDISMLLLSDEVCVLPDWETSPGASIEVMVAVALGLPVWDYEDGRRIDHVVLEHMDPRRFIMPVDFAEWWEVVDVEDDDVDGASDAEPAPPSQQCDETNIPFKGASVSYCSMRLHHAGSHRDVAGREW
jgi:nucleoside 2-deoxyribosyltransferase